MNAGTDKNRAIPAWSRIAAIYLLTLVLLAGTAVACVLLLDFGYFKGAIAQAASYTLGREHLHAAAEPAARSHDRQEARLVEAVFRPMSAT